MPVTVPGKLERNFTPSSTAEVSPESATDGEAKSKSVACGVATLDAADAADVPTAFVAVTLNA